MLEIGTPANKRRQTMPVRDERAGHPFSISVLQEVFAICRLDQDVPIPDWALVGSFHSITRTKGELSIVCPDIRVPRGTVCNRGWRCLKIEGLLDFSLTGILAPLATALADAGISIFPVSTYDTDYIMVQEPDLEEAVSALAKMGYEIH